MSGSPSATTLAVHSREYLTLAMSAMHPWRLHMGTTTSLMGSSGASSQLRGLQVASNEPHEQVLCVHKGLQMTVLQYNPPLVTAPDTMRHCSTDGLDR